MIHRLRHLLLLLACCLTGCAYPRTIFVYDSACQVTAKKMVLEVTDINPSRHCSNKECIAQLVAEAAVLATSTVISGSIVVAGNVVYWLEKQQNCTPRAIAADPAAPSQ